MPKLVSERIKKLREEIAEIRSEPHANAQERRSGGQRLQEILEELMTLTDWKKT